ncbi:neoverrucotoxin subunit alpha [Oreochromis niloticus]|uniref:Neoverrucotoxin subunit alpha n=1 Tax=Oreochromis niloticus TaxID=8128 RepID=A0A669F917_ORENI|nr:neoverrucotoxin subunit alpha [Oreochromis niloticus]XP_025765689.1 neoverrucotoxin subunit alpha [Oreochromis niloticus]XP_025765690.1 neoverrucotoxin subunit alpha [Oreochromis niloticus]XP_025765691.1 neoverrucotoxin subunit alpha [Oreochromis niloticus]
MASDIMQVAALGRPFTLGMLYDARRDKLIPGVTLWAAKTLQEKSVENNQNASNFEVSASDSTENKSSQLDVNASLKASFMSGLIEVEGSAKYLNDKKKSHHQCRVTLQYKATTKFKQLMLTPDETKNTQEAEDVKTLATHVVTGILYGANAFFVFDSEKLDPKNIQEIKGTMQTVIKKIPSFNVDGKVDIKLSDEEKAVTDKFTCKFYGDFILESNPGTFEDAVKTYIQLPKLLGENRENCVPLKVTLMPLKILNPEAAEMMTGISVGLVRKAQDALKDLYNLEISCNDLLEDRVVRSFPQIQEKLSRFKKLCIDFRSSLQQKMVKKLPSIRAGEEDEQELVKVFNDRDKSPFSQERLTKWIEDEEREVTIIRYFVDMMEGTKIISDQSELDREVFNPGVEEVLCFVFTSLKSTDPYLQNMSDYLEKKKLEGTDGNTPPAQDQWYHSDEVRAKMKEKAEAVKNCSRLFITATENDKYKGATIYHYRNTNLVTDDFSRFIDVTDVENITNRGVLMWYACGLTLDPNTANNNLIPSEGNKKVTHGESQSYPDHPERFDVWPHILCREALTGRHYWEVELNMNKGADAAAAVCYRKLERKGEGRLTGFGWNNISWSLGFKWDPDPTFYAEHDGKTTYHPLPPTGCPRLGVFLDWPAGTLSYYTVSFNKLSHIHTFRTNFSESVFPAFKLWTKNSSVLLCL